MEAPNPQDLYLESSQVGIILNSFITEIFKKKNSLKSTSFKKQGPVKRLIQQKKKVKLKEKILQITAINKK